MRKLVPLFVFVAVVVLLSGVSGSLPSVFIETFDGPTLDSSRWNTYGNGSIIFAPSGYVTITNTSVPERIVSIPNFAVATADFLASFTGIVRFGFISQDGTNNLLFESFQDGSVTVASDTVSQHDSLSFLPILPTGFNRFRIVWTLSYIAYYIGPLSGDMRLVHNETTAIPQVNMNVILQATNGQVSFDSVTVGSLIAQSTMTVTSTITNRTSTRMTVSNTTTQTFSLYTTVTSTSFSYSSTVTGGVLTTTLLVPTTSTTGVQYVAVQQTVFSYWTTTQSSTSLFLSTISSSTTVPHLVPVTLTNATVFKTSTDTQTTTAWLWVGQISQEQAASLGILALLIIALVLGNRIYRQRKLARAVRQIQPVVVPERVPAMTQQRLEETQPSPPPASTEPIPIPVEPTQAPQPEQKPTEGQPVPIPENFFQKLASKKLVEDALEQL